EGVEAAERGRDRVAHLARRRAAGAGRHPLPEHAVIPVAAAVVAHCGADVFRNAVDTAADLLDALALKVGMLFQRGVEIGDVSLMMLPVMDLHRLRVDVRLER